MPQPPCTVTRAVWCTAPVSRVHIWDYVNDNLWGSTAYKPYNPKERPNFDPSINHPSIIHPSPHHHFYPLESSLRESTFKTSFEKTKVWWDYLMLQIPESKLKAPLVINPSMWVEFADFPQRQILIRPLGQITCISEYAAECKNSWKHFTHFSLSYS